MSLLALRLLAAVDEAQRVVPGCFRDGHTGVCLLRCVDARVTVKRRFGDNLTSRDEVCNVLMALTVAMPRYAGTFLCGCRKNAPAMRGNQACQNAMQNSFIS